MDLTATELEQNNTLCQTSKHQQKSNNRIYLSGEELNTVC